MKGGGRAVPVFCPLICAPLVDVGWIGAGGAVGRAVGQEPRR